MHSLTSASNRPVCSPHVSEQRPQTWTKKRSSGFAEHQPAQSFVFILNCLLLFQLALADSSVINSSSVEQEPTRMSDPRVDDYQVQKQKVLHSIRQVLENYSDDAIRRILDPTALSSASENEVVELTPAKFVTASTPTTSKRNSHDKFRAVDSANRTEDSLTSLTSRPKPPEIMRIRADIRSSSSVSSSAQQNDERPLNRHYRSARNDWLQNHRRRRKGCTPLHGRDQLLCPSRNTHRYDVCISREQLCDHVVDCPGGEDEDVQQCFFYKPLDDQLKTLSHAVLLLVDNIMADSQRRKQEL